MDNIDLKCILRFPEEYLGEVMGKLTACDAVIHDVENKEGISMLRAKLEQSQIKNLEIWFQKLTNGSGVISYEDNESK